MVVAVLYCIIAGPTKEKNLGREGKINLAVTFGRRLRFWMIYFEDYDLWRSVQFVPRRNLSITTLDLKVVFLQDQDSYIRRRILELLCKNGVQGVKFCLQTTPPAAAAGTNTDAALYSSDEAREATDDDIAEVEGRGATSVPPAVSQSVAVRRLFSGLPQRMENTLCRLKVVCP